MVMVLFVSCFVNADKMHGLSKWCVILIWMVSFTVVTGQDCNISNFNNGQISHLNIDIVGMEETYSNEKQIIVPCKHGFTGFFKIKCSGGVWTKVLGDKCTAKSCGHPGESLNADFTLVSGTDFVFPSQVQYKCHEGYIMVSRNPYRRCLDQGWSGNTPTCEAIKCPDITVDENVLVTGNRLQSSYGNVLQFGCRNRLLALYGPLHIRCEGNGQWNEGPPTCDEVKCKVPDIANGRAHNTEYAEGQHLTITCNDGYSPSGRRPQCLNIRKRAGWSQTPLCERVTCQLPQERGTTYPDGYTDRFLPGKNVSVNCAQGYWFSFNDQQTQKTITCTESGKWISAGVIWMGPCQVIRCQDPNDPNLKERLRSTGYGGYAYYRCKQGFRPTDYVIARCTENGWTPNPLCEVPSQCNLPKRVENAVITEKKREVYSDGDGVTYKCRTNYRMEGESVIRCQRGQWTPGTPTCIRKFFFSNGIEHKSRISCIATTKVVTVTPDRGRLHHGFALFFRTIISNFFDSGDQVIWLSFMPTLLLCS
uniref:Sushi domain-containing protein n=1 Tax=Gadus morhua TaxID=8049 RepID=A0A8C5C9L1_GADMO